MKAINLLPRIFRAMLSKEFALIAVIAGYVSIVSYALADNFSLGFWFHLLLLPFTNFYYYKR